MDSFQLLLKSGLIVVGTISIPESIMIAAYSDDYVFAIYSVWLVFEFVVLSVIKSKAPKWILALIASAGITAFFIWYEYTSEPWDYDLEMVLVMAEVYFTPLYPLSLLTGWISKEQAKEAALTKYKNDKNKLKRLKIGAVIVVALLITVKPILYFEANFYEERGEYKNAKVVYSILGDYKDSKEKVQNVSAIIDNEDSLTKDTVNDESEDTADSTAASDEQNSSESHMLMTLSEDNHRSWDAGDNEAFELFKDMSDGLSKESAEEKYGAFKRGRRAHYDNPDKYRGLAEYKCANLTEEGKPTDIDVVFLVRTSDSEEVFSRITWATDYNKLQSSAFEQTCYAVADTLGVKCHGYNYDFYKEDGRYYWQRYEAYFGDVTLTCYYGDGYQNWYLDKEGI